MEKGEKNYYEILEISPQANQDEVYNGYIKAKNAYSQDSLALYSIMTKDQCVEMIKSIDEAYLIIRGLRTLDTRLNQHYENTKQIIKFLKKQKKIKEILYPHNPLSKNYKLWKKYYSGATGLLSIVVKSKKKSSVIKFVNSLELFGIGYSWGGFESLAILQELRSNKKDEYLQGRKYYRFNKDEHIVRLHIGLEDPKDLINDLKRSLRYIK